MLSRCCVRVLEWTSLNRSVEKSGPPLMDVFRFEVDDSIAGKSLLTSGNLQSKVIIDHADTPCVAQKSVAPMLWRQPANRWYAEAPLINLSMEVARWCIIGEREPLSYCSSDHLVHSLEFP